MAQNRSRHRSARTPVVEARLDPTWQSPYSASPQEVSDNESALAASFRVQYLAGMTLSVAGVVLLLAAVALGILGIVGAVALLAGIAILANRAVTMTKWRHDSLLLADRILGEFEPVADTTLRQRIGTIAERLSATFGLADVSCFIVKDSSVNATFLPLGDPGRWALIVTSGLLSEIELIDLEGVVAHCMARVRLRLTDRRSVAAVSTLNPDKARELAGRDQAYRADEIAAASIRYPLGIARALEFCAQNPATSGYFVSAAYAQQRWVWFDQYADQAQSPLGDLDRADVRARALLEW